MTRPTIRDFTDAIAAISPNVEAAKTGTAYESHDGWGMRHDRPGRVQCSCGDTLDQVLGLPPQHRFWMALCTVCRLSMPFGTEAERDDWVVAHGGEGHEIHTWEEIR